MKKAFPKELHLIICNDDWTEIFPMIADSREEALLKVASNIIQNQESPTLQPHADGITGGGTPNARLQLHELGDPISCLITLTAPMKVDHLKLQRIIEEAQRGGGLRPLDSQWRLSSEDKSWYFA
jgi:hypothetical protein